MPKRTKKLIVYLDQNFISEMAKADSNKRVKPEFRHIYELLHEGFLDEKLVVPASWFHDVETSLSVELKERIVSYQNYLGQVRLNFPESVWRAQIMAFASIFKGNSNVDPLSINIAFEGGEAETLVIDCPLFNKKIIIEDSEKIMDSANSGIFNIKKARLVNKN